MATVANICSTIDDSISFDLFSALLMRILRTDTETPCDESQGFLRHQQRFRLLRGGSRLLVWICKTFGPTRSGSGNAQAAQEPLRARLLLHILQSDPQARLHP